MLHVLISAGIGVIVILILVRVFINMGRQEDAEFQQFCDEQLAKEAKAQEDLELSAIAGCEDQVLLEILSQAKTEEERQQILRFAQDNMPLSFNDSEAEPFLSAEIDSGLIDAAASGESLSQAEMPDAEDTYKELAQAAIDKNTARLAADFAAKEEMAVDQDFAEYAAWKKEHQEMEGDICGYTPELEDSGEIDEYLLRTGADAAEEKIIQPHSVIIAPEFSLPPPDMASANEQQADAKQPSHLPEESLAAEFLPQEEPLPQAQSQPIEQKEEEKADQESFDQKLARLENLFQSQMAAMEQVRQEMQELLQKRNS
jgi:hypothetical protein